MADVNFKAKSLEKNKNGNELRIRRISQKMKEEAKNIADHLGISDNDFLKVKLLDIINSYPDHYKKPMED